MSIEISEDSNIEEQYDTLEQFIVDRYNPGEEPLLPILVFVGDEVPIAPVEYRLSECDIWIPIHESARSKCTEGIISIGEIPATVFVADYWNRDPDTGIWTLGFSVDAELADGSTWEYVETELEIKPEQYDRMGFIHSMMGDSSYRLNYCVDHGIDMDDSIPEFPRE